MLDPPLIAIGIIIYIMYLYSVSIKSFINIILYGQSEKPIARQLLCTIGKYNPSRQTTSAVPQRFLQQQYCSSSVPFTGVCQYTIIYFISIYLYTDIYIYSPRLDVGTYNTTGVTPIIINLVGTYLYYLCILLVPYM